jgi:hypothetical protein
VIDEALLFLRNRLNAHLKSFDGGALESSEDRVVFVDGESMDPIRFKLGAVSLLLMNTEEEKILRPADRHAATDGSGNRRRIQPEIRLNLFVLCVARYRRYEEGLAQIGRILQYFQIHPVLDRESAPELSERICRLGIELRTLPFSEQNELWSSLRTTYHPSVLYRVGMVFFRDERIAPSTALEETVLRLPE